MNIGPMSVVGRDRFYRSMNGATYEFEGEIETFNFGLMAKNFTAKSTLEAKRIPLADQWIEGAPDEDTRAALRDNLVAALVTALLG